MNIFIIIKITKSARFRKRFQRQGAEDDGCENDIEVHVPMNEISSNDYKHQSEQGTMTLIVKFRKERMLLYRS